MEVKTIEVFNAIENYGRNILKKQDLSRRLRRDFASAVDAPSPSDFVCHLSRFIGRAYPKGESKNRLKVLDKESRETKFLSNLYGRKLLSFAYFLNNTGWVKNIKFI